MNNPRKPEMIAIIWIRPKTWTLSVLHGLSQPLGQVRPRQSARPRPVQTSTANPQNLKLYIRLQLQKSKDNNVPVTLTWKIQNSILFNLSNKLTAWHQNPKVHHRIHNSPPTIPILSQVNPLHPPPPPTNLPKVHFDLILPSMPSSFKWSFFLQAFPPKPLTFQKT
jgi:hypothetical protein